MVHLGRSLRSPHNIDISKWRCGIEPVIWESGAQGRSLGGRQKLESSALRWHLESWIWTRSGMEKEEMKMENSVLLKGTPKNNQSTSQDFEIRIRCRPWNRNVWEIRGFEPQGCEELGLRWPQWVMRDRREETEDPRWTEVRGLSQTKENSSHVPVLVRPTRPCFPISLCLLPVQSS